ncbi:hypothetical protein Sa4125_42190 [Aureimonas sp. SA4125]|uniref:YkvA family protein n=1 Tax=Aureimonas sp. SA4125 TaxID=2826993 RepID=UPI001CC5B09D|nr:YkvA family protein [Aureimonas sp. SA4125]BDA86677.1 hypothetical protein Sa4125_42190 [Aureimonas sp. SA4125]
MDRSKIEEILAPASLERQAEQESRVRGSFFETLRRAARHIPFSRDLVASYYCAVDPQTPSTSKGILLAALAYFVLPIDFVPDFLFGLGFTDDIAVLWAAFGAVRHNIKPEHYVLASEALGEAETPA